MKFVQLKGTKIVVSAKDGLVPACAWCGQIRDWEGGYHEIDLDCVTETGLSVTHGICHACAERELQAVQKQSLLRQSHADCPQPHRPRLNLLGLEASSRRTLAYPGENKHSKNNQAGNGR